MLKRVKDKNGIFIQDLEMGRFLKLSPDSSKSIISQTRKKYETYIITILTEQYIDNRGVI